MPLPPLRTSSAPTYSGVANALSGASGATTTFAGPLKAQKASIGTSTANGLVLENPTAATALATVQQGPAGEVSGAAWVSGVSQTMKTRWVLKPRTSGHVDYVLEYDRGFGYTEAFQYTTSEPNIFAEALLAYRFVSSSGGYLFQDVSGLYRYARAGGALEVYSANTGDPLWIGGEHAVKMIPRSSDGGPYQLEESGTADTTNNTQRTIATVDLPANCVVDVEAVFLPKSGSDGGKLVRRVTITVNSGVATLGTERTPVPDDTPGALAGIAGTIDFSGGQARARFTGIAATNISTGAYITAKVYEA